MIVVILTGSIVFNAYSESCDKTDVLSFKEIKEYSEDKERYQALFETIKKDFMPHGLDLLDSNDLIRFDEYIQLRNSWLKKKRVFGVALANILTRAMLLTIAEYAYNPDAFITKKQYHRIAVELLALVCYEKANIFGCIDNVKEKNWNSLREFETNESNKTELSEWKKYIDQFQLIYFKDTAQNYEVMVTADTIPLVFGNCLKGTAIRQDVNGVVAQTCDLLDIGVIVKTISRSVIDNEYNYNDKFVNEKLNELYCKRKLDFLFFKHINCVDDDLPNYWALRRDMVLNMFKCEDIRAVWSKQ